jgi:hypothetical protein
MQLNSLNLFPPAFLSQNLFNIGSVKIILKLDVLDFKPLLMQNIKYLEINESLKVWHKSVEAI